MKVTAEETVWIIGASDGIGKALAYELDKQGVHLILSARTESKLKAVNESLSNNHTVLPMDISDIGSISQWYQQAFSVNNRLDRIIVMAAIYEPTAINEIDYAYMDQMLRVNLLGPMALSSEVFRQHTQGNCQLAICASIAGYMGLPKAQPYSATKAALINFTESLKTEARAGMDVKLINPGFVRTPLTDKNDFDMPMIMEPNDAAKALVHGLESKSFEVNFPKTFANGLKMVSSLPNGLKLSIAKKVAK